MFDEKYNLVKKYKTDINPQKWMPNEEAKEEISLQLDGVDDGDYIIVTKQSTARNGQIVVAMIEGEATVKTFYKEDGYIRLQPENSTMDPIIVKDCQILGKVIGLFRKI